MGIEQVLFRAQEGRQSEFLASPADVVIYGGAAGGGKTWGLLLEPLRWRSVARYTAGFFRRSYPEITNLGGLWDESEAIYPYFGGQPTKGSLKWVFPGGAAVEFNHMQSDDALQKYDGAQMALIAFDQLEHFTEKQFWYLFARNRTTCGVRACVRATCNPDPDSFLVTGPMGWGSGLISWWIAEDGYADLSRAGVIRWFVRLNGRLYWGDSRDELIEQFPESRPKSITFIPATVYDNKELLAKDPDYLANLEALPLIERERFLGDRARGGNWKIKAEAGKVFNRSWFEVVQSVPQGGIEGSGWDFAATIQKQKSDDPDYTARVRMRKVGGTFYILGASMERIAAGEIDAFLKTTSAQDRAMALAEKANRFLVRWEIEPGSSGLRVSLQQTRDLAGYDAIGVPITGDKLQRARGLAAQAVVGNVKLLAGLWNDNFMAYLHGFPDLAHDDLVDAASVIFNVLADLPEEPQQPQARQAQAIERAKIRQAFS